MKRRLWMFAVLILTFTGAASADALDGLAVMTLSPGDGKAVIKASSGSLSVVAIGDSIAGSHYVARQVLSDRLLVKDSRDRGMGSLIWLHRSPSGSPSRVERIKEVEPESRTILVPGTSEH